MVPPPDSGNANKHDDDPLGGMDPMAWLESLAKRQGAKAEELTTAANIDVPLPPPDTKIDEPGYTPGYESEKTEKVAARPAAPSTPLPPPTPKAEPVAAAAGEDPLGGMDPMAWLESLAKRQGAKAEELTTAANLEVPLPPPGTKIDEPGYTPGYESARTEPVAAKPATPPPVPPPAAKAPEPAKPPAVPIKPVEVPPPAPAAEPVAAAAGEDPLGGMDPMAWLESLARRQGAKSEELTTAANIDVPLPPPDTMIEEPGYVDYDPFSAGGPGRTAPREEPAAPQPAGAPAGGDLMGGMDPLAWLESLAGQGEPPTLEAAPAEDLTAIFSPRQFEAAQSMSDDEAAKMLGLGETTSQPATEMDPLAWLESLAEGKEAATPAAAGTETNDLFAAFTAPADSIAGAMAPESTLSWLEQLASEQTGEEEAPVSPAVPAMPAPSVPAPAVTLEGGMSSDISEVQAWLNAQARNLELTREALESQPDEGELAPAQPGEIPDWLRDSMVGAPGEPSVVAPALNEQIAAPATPADLPPWLTEAEPTQDITFDTELVQPASTLPPAQPTAAAHVTISPEEMAAMTRPASPEEVDSWAEALDEEYDRRHGGDESVPDWYLEALARASEGGARRPAATVTPAQPTAVPEPVITSPEPMITPTPAVSGVPDWLMETGESGEVPAEATRMEVPDWLRAMAPDAATATPAPEIPDWLKPTGATGPLPPLPAQPAAEPARPVPPPVAQPAPTPAAPAAASTPARPAPPAPVGAAADYVARLKQAREFVAGNQVAASLEHYQALIDGSQFLEESRADLRTLVHQNPKEPRLRRLLGDTHMRLGDLQAALDTYLSALDQL